jgi:hypothetical protein
VSVASGTSYDFEFDATFNGGARDLRVDVFDGDVTADSDFLNGIVLAGDLYAQTVDLVGPTSVYSQYGQTGLLPTLNKVTIRFWDLEQSTAAAGIWLDDVQLNGQEPQEGGGGGGAVPEPGTLALTALGLFSLRLFAWRRRETLSD